MDQRTRKSNSGGVVKMIHYRKSENPDIVTPPELLEKAMGELGVDFDLWCEDQIQVDKPHWAFDNFRTGGRVEHQPSKLFYTQPSWGLHFMDKVGKDKVKLLTYAVDEEIYPEVEDEQVYDIGFIGNVIDGDGREEWLNLVKDKYNCFFSSSVATKYQAREYAKCKVIYNPIRFEEVNIRFFEALACGVQLCSYSPALNLFAEEGKHYLAFRDENELFTKLDHLLENPNVRKKMRKEARKEVLRRHTYKHRVKEILNFI